MNIDSPCIRDCCLDPNDICVGCFRTIDEITGWSKRSAEDKLAILEQCKNRRNQAEEEKQVWLKHITQ